MKQTEFSWFRFDDGYGHYFLWGFSVLPFLPSKEKQKKETYLEFYCDTDRLALIRQQREEAARKRGEEKAGKTLEPPLLNLFSDIKHFEIDEHSYLIVLAKEQKKVEARKWLSYKASYTTSVLFSRRNIKYLLSTV